MALVQLIDVCPQIEILHAWCIEQFATEQPTFSTYATGRTDKAFNHSFSLTNAPRISEGYRDKLVTQLGDRYLPRWHSATLGHYLPGVGMRWHRDHKACCRMVVLVNIGCATLRITDKEYVHTNEDVEVYQLEHGAVIRFDSKLLHRLDPVKQERWSLSFRHLKSEYLP